MKIYFTRFIGDAWPFFVAIIFGCFLSWFFFTAICVQNIEGCDLRSFWLDILREPGNLRGIVFLLMFPVWPGVAGLPGNKANWVVSGTFFIFGILVWVGLGLLVSLGIEELQARTSII